MRLTEMTPLLPVRLIEHPGHRDQKVHGRRGSGPPDLKEQLDKLDAGLRTIRGAERIVAIDPKTGKVTLNKGNDGTAVTLTLQDDIALAGIYPAVAQSFTVAATRLGVSPQKVQAVVWVR